MPVGVAVRSGGAHERNNDAVTRDRERILRGALEGDDRQMLASTAVVEQERISDRYLQCGQWLGRPSRLAAC